MPHLKERVIMSVETETKESYAGACFHMRIENLLFLCLDMSSSALVPYIIQRLIDAKELSPLVQYIIRLYSI